MPDYISARSSDKTESALTARQPDSDDSKKSLFVWTNDVLSY